MGIFNSITNSIRGSFDKRREEREQLEQLKREADIHRRQVFQEEFKQRAFQVAEKQAREDAEKLSGFNKLRAINRSHNLQNPTNEGVLGKISEYTRRNMANRVKNLDKTQQLRSVAKEEKDKRLIKNKLEREARMLRNHTLKWR